MVILQGDVFWADLGIPLGSAPAGQRPVLVVQSDPFNKSRLKTVIVAVVTSNLKLRELPGNVYLKRGLANLPKPSVVNVTQLVTIDRGRLGTKLGQLPSNELARVLDGIDIVLRGSRA